MKKSMLYTGIGYLLIGCCFMLLALLYPQTTYTSLYWGFTGAGIGPGLMIIYRYFYWSMPQNAAIYQAHLQEERINLQDERKVMLRAKAGQLTYQITLGLLLLATFVSAVLLIDKRFTLGFLLLAVFMYVTGIVIFRQLSKKM